MTTRKPKVFVTFGTRPEAIKMFPLVEALKATDSFDVRVAVTAQHRDMLDQVLKVVGLEPDIDLNLMTSGQSLDELASRILIRFGEVLDTESPQRVLVHGDTLTTMMVTLACYFRKIPVGHIEAGLRSGDIYSPWPEEMNRKFTTIVADLHFAPTYRAKTALLQEAVPESAIHVTGNTVVDALYSMRDRIERDPNLASKIEAELRRFEGKRIIAVTAHRRENFGEGLRGIARAVAQLARRDDTAIIFPIHPNPEVAEVMRPMLGNIPNISLIEPLDYPNFVKMMEAADLILTDSGGVQEEAPSFHTPVLVMRDTTERPEAIESGVAQLVGTDEDRIIASANQLLDDSNKYQAVAEAGNPFGDGSAAKRIVDILESNHSKRMVF